MNNSSNKFAISKSLNGDQVVYIARDKSGAVRFRENSQEELEKAIKTHIDDKKSPPAPATSKKTTIDPDKKKFLENKLQKLVQQKRSGTVANA